MDKKKRENIADISQLNAKEKHEISNKVELETALSHYNMIQLGAIANIISGIFIIWILYDSTNLITTLGWYSILVFFNVINIIWAFRNRGTFEHPQQLRRWKMGFEVILAGICLTWGSLGILFASNNTIYELYTITFLQVVVIGFCFTSVTDFTIAFISISSLVFPSVVFRFYRAYHAWHTIGHDPGLNLELGISLFILGAFLLTACYFGAKLVKKFFFLSFANTLLNQKLDNLNKFLEQRVKERTIELENSLNLVTYQATHDLLTDLPNQRLLAEFIDKAIADASQSGHMFAVACFSLNEIEKINDGLGHHIGDQVIKTIAQRFQKTISQTDEFTYKVALSRKDVFVVVLESLHDLNELESKAEKLFAILDEPIYTENEIIKLTGSIGISVYPRNGEDIQTLLMNADAAMFKAHQMGGNSVNIYSSEINADISKQLELASNLHTALKKSEFMLHYQPFVNAKTGDICGFEALVRWEHPVLGLVPPDKFIPLAETNGIIIPLGEWVMRSACKQTKEWQKLGFFLKGAINLSARQLQQKNIIQLINSILKECDLEPKYIELELTETAAFQAEVIPVIKQFKETGLGLSIDDFGTGYSGLSNLKLFSIDKLKIDKSFVQDLLTSRNSRTIVTNIIAMARKMNITILAEGVETQEQLKILQRLGCDLIQGYYFSCPVSAEVFTKLLTDRKHFDI